MKIFSLFLGNFRLRKVSNPARERLADPGLGLGLCQKIRDQNKWPRPKMVVTKIIVTKMVMTKMVVWS